MYKSKTKQREATKERVRRYRNKGVTSSTGGGVTSEQGVTISIIEPASVVIGRDMEGVTFSTGEDEGVTYPNILDKLTDPVWRDRLSRLQAAFEHSHHPDYASACWLGDCNLSLAFDLLECTA